MLAKLPAFLSVAAPHAILGLATILAVDVAAYFLLPEAVAAKFYHYRMNKSVVGKPAAYPRDYFVSHPTRGHDIAPGRRSTHEIPEIVYPIWSNDFGCFDKSWETVPDRYVYFAGDSFTWGYTPFDDKFPTIFERETGKPSLKCGVTATGTWHQFAKFQDLLGRIGKPPERVIVSFFSNDIADDYEYPNVRVIDGAMVNASFLDERNHLVRVDEAWLREQVAVERNPIRDLSCDTGIWTRVKCFSLTANVINAARKALAAPDQEAKEHQPQPITEYGGKPLWPILKIENTCWETDRLRYATCEAAAGNRNAVRAWSRHARENGYTLSLMLIPPPWRMDSATAYSEVASYMTSLGIDVVDLTTEFARLGISSRDAYWRYDGHFNARGNRLAADALVARWGQRQ